MNAPWFTFVIKFCLQFAWMIFISKLSKSALDLTGNDGSMAINIRNYLAKIASNSPCLIRSQCHCRPVLCIKTRLEIVVDRTGDPPFIIIVQLNGRNTDGLASCRRSSNSNEPTQTPLFVHYQIRYGTDVLIAVYMDGWIDWWPDGLTEGWTDERTEGRIDGRTDGWRTNGRTNWRTHGLTDGRTDERTDGRTNGLTDGRTDGRTNGLTDRRTDGLTDERTDDCGINLHLFKDYHVSCLCVLRLAR